MTTTTNTRTDYSKAAELPTVATDGSAVLITCGTRTRTDGTKASAYYVLAAPLVLPVGMEHCAVEVQAAFGLLLNEQRYKLVRDLLDDMPNGTTVDSSKLDCAAVIDYTTAAAGVTKRLNKEAVTEWFAECDALNAYMAKVAVARKWEEAAAKAAMDGLLKDLVSLSSPNSTPAVAQCKRLSGLFSAVGITPQSSDWREAALARAIAAKQKRAEEAEAAAAVCDFLIPAGSLDQ